MLVHSSAGSTDGNTVTTPALTTTGANAILLMVAGGSIADTDVTDSAGNTWVGHNQGGVSASGIGLNLFVSSIGATMSAAHTATCTHTGSNPSIIMLAFDGATSWDQFVVGTANTGLTSIQSNAYTPNQPNEVVFAGLLTLQAKSALSINTGFIILENVNASATATGVAAAYLIEAGTVTVQPTWSWTTAVTANATQTGFIGTFTPTIPPTASPVWLYFGQTLGLGDMLATGIGLKFARDIIRNPIRSRRRFLIGGEKSK